MDQALVAGVGTGAVYGLFALGLVLVYKTTRVLNFAQAEVGTFATYLLWTLAAEHGMPWGFAALCALAAAGLVGYAFERFVARPLVHAERLTLTVATIALGLFFGGLELEVWGASPRILPNPFTGVGLRVAGVVLTPPRLTALAATAVIGVFFAWFFRRTTFGLALLAAAQDSVGVRLTGIRLRHLSAFTWVVSSLLGALAGIIIALSLGAFAEYFMLRIMLLGFAAAVVGGMTSLPGALVGGLLVGLGEAMVSYFWYTVPGLVETLVFGLIVVMLLVRPQGLLGRAA